MIQRLTFYLPLSFPPLYSSHMPDFSSLNTTDLFFNFKVVVFLYQLRFHQRNRIIRIYIDIYLYIHRHISIHKIYCKKNWYILWRLAKQILYLQGRPSGTAGWELLGCRGSPHVEFLLSNRKKPQFCPLNCLD